MEFVTAVKMHIYQQLRHTGRAPAAAECAAALGETVARAAQAYQRLAGEHLLVLEPGDSQRIRMALPFSGIETPHRVVVGDKRYYANCAWDALGIAAALGSDALIESGCDDCGEPISLQVQDGSVSGTAVAHFAVPAAHWWDDIIYT